MLTNTSCFQQLDPTVTPELCSARRHHPCQGKAIPSAAPGTDLRPLRALLGQQPPLLLAAAPQPLGLPGRAVREEILLPAGAPRGLPTLRLLRRAAGRQRGGEGRESGRQPRHSGRRAEPEHPGLQCPLGLPVPRVPRRLPGPPVLRWPPRTPVPGAPAVLPQASYRGSPRYLPGPLISGSPRCLLFPGTTAPPGASASPRYLLSPLTAGPPAASPLSPCPPHLRRRDPPGSMGTCRTSVLPPPGTSAAKRGGRLQRPPWRLGGLRAAWTGNRGRHREGNQGRDAQGRALGRDGAVHRVLPRHLTQTRCAELPPLNTRRSRAPSAAGMGRRESETNRGLE